MTKFRLVNRLLDGCEGLVRYDNGFIKTLDGVSVNMSRYVSLLPGGFHFIRYGSRIAIFDCDGYELMYHPSAESIDFRQSGVKIEGITMPDNELDVYSGRNIILYVYPSGFCVTTSLNDILYVFKL